MRRSLLAFCVFALVSSSLAAASSSVKVKTEAGTRKLPSVSATRLIMNDGTTRMFLLFAEKSPTNVILVDSTGNEGLSLGAWTSATNAMAVKISFVEGGHENYSNRQACLGHISRPHKAPVRTQIPLKQQARLTTS